MPARSVRCIAGGRGPHCKVLVARPCAAGPSCSPRVQGSRSMTCRAAATEVEVLTREVVAAPGVTELTIETWEAFMDNAGEHHVLVDFYTDWCGPCKLISPELEKFSQQYQGHPIKFAKFNCGTQDKRFAIEKGIKALPTFHMYRGNEKQGEFVGAKPVALRKFVEQHIDVC